MTVLAPRVVEATNRGFQCAYERYAEHPYGLGQVVAVREGPHVVFGVVADAASGPEDPSRPLQSRGQPGQTAAEVMAANPEIRMLLRTRVTIVICGYAEGEVTRATLPPVPPPLLAEVERASPQEIARVAEGGAFLSLLLNAPGCDDEVIAAAVRAAGTGLSAPVRREFVISAGKELARLLKAEPARLASIIRSVGP
ncbi:MAG: hypothetical protein WEC33_04160 [Dehalococcoidia bacterium]